MGSGSSVLLLISLAACHPSQAASNASGVWFLQLFCDCCITGFWWRCEYHSQQNDHWGGRGFNKGDSP